MKKITIFGIAIISVVVIACATFRNNDDKVTQINTTIWKKKAPILFNNVGYNKLIQSNDFITNSSESMQKLGGIITNPFGIRDDILDYIIKNIPASEDKLMKASIIYANSEQKIYYTENISNDEIFNLDRRSDLMTTCIFRYFNDINLSNNFLKGMESLMRNTKERNERMWYVDRKYFSWKVLGSGYSVADENIICDKGNF